MLFSVIDGPNGVGKTTVINFLNKELTARGLKVKIVHFHRRGTLIGDAIQDILNGDVELDMEAMQMLYAVDMLDFSNRQYKEIQDNGYDVLLSDRYNTSSLAIGTSLGIDLKKLQDYHKYDVRPDVNYILCAEPEQILARVSTQEKVAGQTGDIFEEDTKLLNIIRSYRNLKNIMDNIVEIDTTVSSIVGAEMILKDILYRLKYSSSNSLHELFTFREKRNNIMKI